MKGVVGYLDPRGCPMVWAVICRVRMDDRVTTPYMRATEHIIVYGGYYGVRNKWLGDNRPVLKKPDALVGK